MKKIVKQILAFITILIFLLFRAMPIQAIDTPTPPTPPDTPTVESSLNLPTPPPTPNLEEIQQQENEQTANNTLEGNNIETENNGLTVQENQAEVDNKLEMESSTGDNSASYNTGEDSLINTGDANTTGTIITSLNTNIDAVSVSEFNIDGNQNRDLNLDFDANCISGCNSSASAQNTGNGADSTNNVLINNLSDDTTPQTNDADIDSSLILSSDSGNNSSSYNTNGDSTIQTGDANTSGNVLTFANNNIAGKVIFGVVNIFGNLVGDIILPEDLVSENNTTVTTSDTENTFQTNIADIDNNFIVTATTGDNKTSYNTNGDSTIKTGDADAAVQVINIANSNLKGESMWLVIVNKAGEWAGQILGAPEGNLFAGSSGTEFSVNPSGEITATNSGNEAGSTVQENIAKIVNNLVLSANTGKNNASYNTGGNSTISTGDAKAIANLVNFVNNNISGNGKLVVTIVNVFGSWVGDFVTPGSKKENHPNTQNQAAGSPQENSNGGIGGPQIASLSNNQSSIQTQSSSSNNSNPPSTSNIQNSSPLQNVVEEENIALVAGEKIENSGNILTEGVKDIKKTTALNLAWLLLLLPTIPLLYLFRKR